MRAPSMPVRSCPMDRWRTGAIDEAAGTVAHDVTGNGNDRDVLHVGYGHARHDGRLDRRSSERTAAQLDGLTAYILMSAIASGSRAMPRTSLEIWAEPQNISVSYQRLFSRELQTSPREGYLLFDARRERAARSSTLVPPSASGAGRPARRTSVPRPTPSRRSGTISWRPTSGATSRVYLDGTVVATPACCTAGPSTRPRRRCGSGASIFDTAGYFDGQIDEVAVYGTALSAARVAAHFHASDAADPPIASAIFRCRRGIERGLRSPSAPRLDGVFAVIDGLPRLRHVSARGKFSLAGPQYDTRYSFRWLTYVPAGIAVLAIRYGPAHRMCRPEPGKLGDSPLGFKSEAVMTMSLSHVAWVALTVTVGVTALGIGVAACSLVERGRQRAGAGSRRWRRRAGRPPARTPRSRSTSHADVLGVHPRKHRSARSNSRFHGKR